MREEHVTKAVLQHLVDCGWSIVCYDYPQSGTGRALHPDGEKSKTKGIIVPDVVATQDGIVLYLENKDRYYQPDYEKVHDIIVRQNYQQAFRELLAGVSVNRMMCGIGLPSSAYVGDAVANAVLVDVVVGVDDDGSVRVLHDNSGCLRL